MNPRQLDKKIDKIAGLIETLDYDFFSNALFVDGVEVNKNFKLAIANIPNVDVLPTGGANVYDILRREKLVLTKAAVECLMERLK